MAKKTLISLLTGALILLNSGCATKHGLFDMGVDAGLSAGQARSRITSTPYEGWQQNFRPGWANMGTHKYDSNIFSEAMLTVRPTFIFQKDWEIGIPIIYSLNALDYNCPLRGISDKRCLAMTTAQWWDEVPITTIDLEKTTPRIGIYARRNDFALQLSGQGYNISRTDYRGVDVYGGRNESEPISTKDLEKGVSYRADVLYFGKKSLRGEDVGMGVFYEQAGRDSWQAGIYGQIGISGFFSFWREKFK